MERLERLSTNFRELIQAKLKSAGSNDDRVKALIEAIRNHLKSSLYAFCHFLGYMDVSLRVHGEIIAALEAPTKRKVICVPRGSLKSSIAAQAYPMWRLIKDPNLRILIDSELYSNSITYLRTIKQHLESELMVTIFGQFRTDAVWREDAIIINQRAVNLKEPSIVAGGIGTTKVGQHFDCVIADDYNSPGNTQNKDQAQKVIDHFRYNLSILEPGGETVVIGTRYSEHDLIGWLLREVLDEPRLAEGKFDQVGSLIKK